MAMRCPNCRATATSAYAVQFRDDATTLSYQCYECGHSWQKTEHDKRSEQPASRDR